MTSEPPDAAGAGDDAAAAVRAATHAPATGRSQPTRRRRYRRAKFLKLSTRPFVFTALLLVATNVATGFGTPWLFDRIEKSQVAFAILGLYFAQLALGSMWVLLQRRVTLCLRLSAAAVSGLTGTCALFYDEAAIDGILSSTASLGVTALLLGGLWRAGVRLARAHRPRRYRRVRVQFSLRSVALLILVASIFLGNRNWQQPSWYVEGGISSTLTFGVLPAATSVLVLIACLALEQLVLRVSLLLLTLTFAVGVNLCWFSPLPELDIARLLASEFFLPMYAAQVSGLAAVFLLIRRVYGLRLVRVPRRMTRSLE